jgi:hypothetical protein
MRTGCTGKLVCESLGFLRFRDDDNFYRHYNVDFVVSLSVGALTYRAYTRNVQVITSSWRGLSIMLQLLRSIALDRSWNSCLIVGKIIVIPVVVYLGEDYLVKMMLNDGDGFPQSID